MDRSQLTRWIPAEVKRRLRPLLAPLAYGLERPRMRSFYGGIVGPGDLVFDIGAAEGFHAAVLSDLGARVICVEPQPYCVDVLKRRFSGDPKVAVVAKGAGDREDNTTLHVSRGDPEISTFAIDKWKSGRFSGHQWEDRVTVPMVTLDRLIEEYGTPVLCKIDVEGFEPQVLAGLSQPLPWVSFEFTREFLEDARQCIDHLASLAPTVFNATLFRRWRFMVPDWENGSVLLHRLAAIPGGALFGDIHARFHGPPGHRVAARKDSKSPS